MGQRSLLTWIALIFSGLMAALSATAASEIGGFHEFRLGMSPAAARAAVAGERRRIIREESAGPLGIVVAEGVFAELPAGLYFAFDQEHLKMLRIDYYFGSHAMPPRKTAAACDDLFAEVVRDLTSQYGDGDRQVDAEGRGVLIKWRSPNRFAVAKEEVYAQDCIAVTAAVFDGDETALREFIANPPSGEQKQEPPR